MALVLLCGLPCSGKTTVANTLHSLLSGSNQAVRIIHDGHDFIGDTTQQSSNEDVCRSNLYADSTAEKHTRARLRAATERALQGKTVVICDSLNYIKGFRYELYCVAKTSGVRYAVIYCTDDAQVCLQRDSERQQSGKDSYGEQLCQQLIRRFEAPGNNRWDKPLYKVDTTQPNWEQTVQTLHDQLLTNKPLSPTMATKLSAKPNADILGTLDRLTRQVENTLLPHLSGELGQTISIPSATKSVHIHRNLPPSHLRDIRRSFLNLARMHPPQTQTTSGLLDEYIEYLNAQFRPS